MNLQKNQAIILMLSAWASIIVIFTAFSSIVDLEILFILWLIGLLVTVEISDSDFIQPPYSRNIRIVTIFAVIIFLIIVALKVMEIIAE